MPGRQCRGHGQEAEQPCSCEMGNLYRFAEPILLLAIARLGEACGYKIAQHAASMAVTQAGWDSGVIYRTLRRLETAGRVRSAWDTSGAGPARRSYVLAESGFPHLGEGAQLREDRAASLQVLAHECSLVARHPLSEALPALAHPSAGSGRQGWTTAG